ncbi:MAG: glycosyltransferase family 2 protein [Hyphomicrobiales bacterium]|nr:glycosyltransferase family 2 protein [Hyphomicrobiales bacterium]MDE2016848.1 glycosyltransferase family 2 protein [Hyphomicrobiales bacterium]
MTAAIICKDEEACIGACLGSLADCAEIVVVDSGSTDRTLDIVREFAVRGLPVRLVENAWPGYAKQKQFALDLASQPWVFSIDADERIDDELRRALPAALAAADAPDAYRVVRRQTLFGLAPGRLVAPSRPKSLRLVRRGKAHFDLAALVHEGLVVDGRIGDIAQGGIVQDRPLRLDDQMAKEIRYATLKARQRVEAGRRPSVLKLLFNPPGYFLRNYFGLRLWRFGVSGFVHAATGAAYSFVAEGLHWQMWRASQARGAASTPKNAGSASR